LSFPRPLDLPRESLSYSIAGPVDCVKQVRVDLVRHHPSRGQKFRADAAALIYAAPHTVNVRNSYYDPSYTRGKSTEGEAYPAIGITSYRICQISSLYPDFYFHWIPPRKSAMRLRHHCCGL
jgi:hypothetical protein